MQKVSVYCYTNDSQSIKAMLKNSWVENELLLSQPWKLNKASLDRLDLQSYPRRYANPGVLS